MPEIDKTHCSIRLYGYLKELVRGNPSQDIFIKLDNSPSVKDLIESKGVPHTEAALVLINGESVSWSERVKNADRIAVYPFFHEFPIGLTSKVLPPELPEVRFIADVHLGTLAHYLRLLGFDTAYENNWEDPYIIDTGVSETRIILTRDRGILKTGRVRYGTLIRHKEPGKQLLQVLDRYSLRGKIHPYSRCLHCNGTILEIDKESIRKQLLADTAKYYHEFFQCENCKQIYWKGSHFFRSRERFLKEFGLDLSFPDHP